MIGVIAIVPMLTLILLAPVGLVYIITSYAKKEEQTKRRLLYLISILLFNALFLFFVYNIMHDIAKVF